MVTLLSHKEEKHSSPNSLKWTDGCLSSRESPILHWNGLMEMPGLAASHTLEEERSFPWSPPPTVEDCPTLSKMDRWMSLQQGVSHTSMKWTDGEA